MYSAALSQRNFEHEAWQSIYCKIKLTGLAILSRAEELRAASSPRNSGSCPAGSRFPGSALGGRAVGCSPRGSCLTALETWLGSFGCWLILHTQTAIQR